MAAFRQVVGVLRFLAAYPGEHLSHASAARAYASSALLRSTFGASISTRTSSSVYSCLFAPFSSQTFSTTRVPFELQEKGKEEQDLDLEEPAGIFHIYERTEPDDKDEEDAGVPWGTISLTGPPPDRLSTDLSLKSKDEIYTRYKENPTEGTVAELASEYKILKQRVLAIVCLKEREEKWEKEVFEKFDDEIKEELVALEKEIDEDAPNTGGGERLWLNMARRMKPKLVVESDNFEADAIVSTSGMSWDEASRRYEEAEYQEFANRLKFNKKLTNGEVLSKAEERKKPEGGWNFMVEELGKDGKRGKGGGRRFVAKADGARRPLNELEKLMMKRETPRRRKFDFL